MDRSLATSSGTPVRGGVVPSYSTERYPRGRERQLLQPIASVHVESPANHADFITLPPEAGISAAHAVIL
jgi:hypothetical protein